jgi:hypothetical protein
MMIYNHSKQASHKLFWLLLLSIFLLKVNVLQATQLGRVLVLELQGEEAVAALRQQWADAMRASITKAYPQFQLISKDAIVMLLPPGESLTDCIGVCESEVSRKVGADWAIGGQLVKDALNPSTQLWVLTLKLHHADGTLVGVEQRQGSLQGLQKNLEKQLKAVTRNLELIVKQHESQLKPQDQSSQYQQSTETKLVEAYTLVSQDWHFLPQNQACISALVTASDYQACLSDNQCSIGELGGRCVFENRSKLKDLLLPMNCVDFSQAQAWIQWTKLPNARLPLESEWHELITRCPQCRSEVLSEWTAQFYSENPQQSKQAQISNPLTAPNILVRGGDRLGASLRDQMPPSFSHSKLGFRIAFPAKSKADCAVLSSKINVINQ